MIVYTYPRKGRMKMRKQPYCGICQYIHVEKSRIIFRLPLWEANKEKGVFILIDVSIFTDSKVCKRDGKKYHNTRILGVEVTRMWSLKLETNHIIEGTLGMMKCIHVNT